MLDHSNASLHHFLTLLIVIIAESSAPNFFRTFDFGVDMAHLFVADHVLEDSLLIILIRQLITAMIEY